MCLYRIKKINKKKDITCYKVLYEKCARKPTTLVVG